MGDYPLAYEWLGDGFRVLPRFAKEADKRFVIGERYLLEELHERSAKSHRHFFASVHAAWQSLPEDIAERFPTDTHLRKYALIKTGFYNERSIVAANKAEARRIAAFVKPMDEFALVVVMEATVVVYTAKSQKIKAMGRVVFQESKTKVLDFLASMVGTKAKELEKADVQ